MGDAANFLYTGENAPQKNVAENAIIPRRAMVLRGLVFDRVGHPIPGVQVTVLGAPEFGHTFSAEDGTFNLALNGGGTFTVNLEKSGYLPVQRTVVDPPWRRPRGNSPARGRDHRRSQSLHWWARNHPCCSGW